MALNLLLPTPHQKVCSLPLCLSTIVPFILQASYQSTPADSMQSPSHGRHHLLTLAKAHNSSWNLTSSFTLIDLYLCHWKILHVVTKYLYLCYPPTIPVINKSNQELDYCIFKVPYFSEFPYPL